MSFQDVQTAIDLPPVWAGWLGNLLEDSRMRQILDRVAAARRLKEVYPAPHRVFAAFGAAGPAQVRCVILGQDPYHGPGQATGLSFAVPPGTPLPPSLRNIFRELAADLGPSLKRNPARPLARGNQDESTPVSRDLQDWADQGVLLLNTHLTVESGNPMSHRGLGWEWFTDGVLTRLAESPDPIVFVLWGAAAKKKESLIRPPHEVLTAAHPSPLSAHRGFFGSRPFSKVNHFLLAAGREPIRWT